MSEFMNQMDWLVGRVRQVDQRMPVQAVVYHWKAVTMWCWIQWYRELIWLKIVHSKLNFNRGEVPVVILKTHDSIKILFRDTLLALLWLWRPVQTKLKFGGGVNFRLLLFLIAVATLSRFLVRYVSRQEIVIDIDLIISPLIIFQILIIKENYCKTKWNGPWTICSPGAAWPEIFKNIVVVATTESEYPVVSRFIGSVDQAMEVVNKE
jgi:hypothetical protein